MKSEWTISGVPQEDIILPWWTGLLCFVLCTFCFVVPISTYAYKMKKRSVDCYYSLPLKKWKVTFVKTLVGLLQVLVPFTIAFWVGTLVMLVRKDNPYQMGWVFPMYFGMVFYAVGLFGFNAFVFTRANSVVDGIVFMLAYIFAWAFVAFDLCGFLHLSEWLMEPIGFLITPAGISAWITNMQYLMCGTSEFCDWNVWMFVMPFLYGVIGYALLFVTLRFDKGENAEQVSESWFGYRLLIPLYAICSIGILGAIGNIIWFVLLFVPIAVGTIVTTMVYRRKFLLPLKSWLLVGISIIGGCVFAVMMAISAAI